MTDCTASLLILDEGAGTTLKAAGGVCWRAVTDAVMGGKSSASLLPSVTEGRHCLRLTGSVSLENNGGFVQASLDLSETGVLDASAYCGIEIEIFGNNEMYNLHLRTGDTNIVWQSYRAAFHARAAWQTIRIPFGDFQNHRIDVPLDKSRLRRLGVVAIGRVMQPDICIGRLSLFSGITPGEF